MSIQGQIDRIKENLDGAYSAISDMGGTLPEQQTSAHLEEAIRSIPSGSKPGTPLDPVQVYTSTRPADWLPMPEPQNDEMYLLFHIPDGVSSLLAFTVTCDGNYTVALGTVTNGAFVQQSAQTVASGAKYEAELFADDYGSLTSGGMKQCMVKVSGININTWQPSAHSKKSSPTDFSVWNIVEIVCKLPEGTSVSCGVTQIDKSLRKLVYFSWVGSNKVTSAFTMFKNCESLIAVLQLDTSNFTRTSYMFSGCYSLMAIPQLNMPNVLYADYMFVSCYSLKAIPPLNLPNAVNINRIFSSCYALITGPQLDTSHIPNISYMFNNCRNLVAVPQLNTQNVTLLADMFKDCYLLSSVLLDPSVTGWEGQPIGLQNCSLGHAALVNLFNSLPTITAPKALTLTGNPGVAELTDAEKAIATGKNWTLTL